MHGRCVGLYAVRCFESVTICCDCWLCLDFFLYFPLRAIFISWCMQDSCHVTQFAVCMRGVDIVDLFSFCRDYSLLGNQQFSLVIFASLRRCCPYSQCPHNVDVYASRWRTVLNQICQKKVTRERRGPQPNRFSSSACSWLRG